MQKEGNKKMVNGLESSLHSIAQLSNAKTYSVCPENFTGEKGKAAMATEGTGKEQSSELGLGWKVSPSVLIAPGTVFEMANISGMGAVKHIWMTDSALFNRSLIIRMYWDGSDIPSVEVPAGDFFASAYYKKYAQLSSLAVCVNPKNGLNCYWEMPFKKSARITLENISDEEIYVYYQIDYIITELPKDSAYFHAQFRRNNPLKYMDVHTILDGIEGKGQYVGTYLFWGVNSNLWWGEGELKFYLDGDKDFPTICTTGTEDYFGGSYNFDDNGKYVEYCTPYSGMPMVVRPDGLYEAQQRFSLYRWHIADPIYFEKDIKVTLQALGWRNGYKKYHPLQDDISSVAYWYQDGINQNPVKLPCRTELELI